MGDVCHSHLAKYKGKPNYTFFIYIISTCKVLQILGYIGSFPANLHKFLLLVMLQRGLFFFCKFYGLSKFNLKYRAISIQFTRKFSKNEQVLSFQRQLDPSTLLFLLIFFSIQLLLYLAVFLNLWHVFKTVFKDFQGK